jgi:hypothetical protein
MISSELYILTFFLIPFCLSFINARLSGLIYQFIVLCLNCIADLQVYVFQEYFFEDFSMFNFAVEEKKITHVSQCVKCKFLMQIQLHFDQFETNKQTNKQTS